MNIIEGSKTFFIRVKNAGWAYVTLAPMGLVQIHSDYGTYGYVWQSRGDETIEQFITNAGIDYITNKFAGGKREFDYEATFSNIKRIILENRKRGDIAPAKARALFDDLVMSEEQGCKTFSELYAYLSSECESVVEFLEEVDATYDLAVTTHPSELKNFMKFMWPEIIKTINPKPPEVDGGNYYDDMEDQWSKRL